MAKRLRARSQRGARLDKGVVVLRPGIHTASLKVLGGNREVLNRKRDLSVSMIRRLHKGPRIPLENLIGKVA